jgi:hypothetical protein
MTFNIAQAFDAIGAALHVETDGHAFEIDVVHQGGRELFSLRYPHGDTIVAEAIDVHPPLRHLVLDVTGDRMPVSGRFLCGHDERHWFVASLPFHRRTQTVRRAMETLKPPEVLREQSRKGVRHRRHRRRTAAYIRQGEWFFLPRPKMHVPVSAIVRNSELVRPGGKPHRVEQLFQSEDGTLTFVRGNVSHPDHATIHLDGWHRVLRNTEALPAPPPVVEQNSIVVEHDAVIRMAYVD